ncbi:MAG: TIGR03621 family F420-dependent LLM class oxidoreductase [Chloroflexia bacterium]|nr:TIGR03621 family F420-dependent LLM class oxidoreductase [Chloroflexia bacterium]
MTHSARPFRFGMQTRGNVDLKGQARRAEALGYDVLLMPDHFGRQLAIGPALAMVAEATTTLRIGTLVWQNDLRHPALLAMEAATLDVLSDGRFELGIGAGGSYPPDFEFAGIPFNPPGVRVSRLEESVRVLKGLAGPDPLTFAGKHYTITNFQGMPKPVQPHLPLLIAGGGARMLRLAAREADIVGLVPRMLPAGEFVEADFGVDAFAAKASSIREMAGDRAGAIEFNILIQMVKVTNDREGEIERLTAEHEIDDASWFDSPMVYVGSVDEICDKMRAMRDRIGVSYFVVFETAYEELAPLVAALAGT